LIATIDVEVATIDIDSDNSAGSNESEGENKLDMKGPLYADEGDRQEKYLFTP
jgi:hypothetical protein